MTDDDYRGSGDEIAEIDLGAAGRIVISDDGYNDADVSVKLYDAEDGEAPRMAVMLSRSRVELGDDAFAAALSSVESGVSVDTSASNGTDWGPGPSYKCDGCGLTWPRGTNQTPGPGDDTCPECDDS